MRESYDLMFGAMMTRFMVEALMVKVIRSEVCDGEIAIRKLNDRKTSFKFAFTTVFPRITAAVIW
jgi:hypothetical protein